MKKDKSSFSSFKTLNKISPYYGKGEEFDSVLTVLEVDSIKNYLTGKDFLELGCSVANSSIELLKYAHSLDIVEASDEIIKIAKKNIFQLKNKSRINFHKSLWEDFKFQEKYSDIMWVRGIEHVKNPLPILKKIARSLKKSHGRLHLVTVNALSLNRRIGVYMGLLSNAYELSDRDRKFGHYVIYDRVKLLTILKKAGFKIINCQGIMLKPLPNKKMYQFYKESPNLIKAFYDIGHELPDYCTEVYICAEPKD